MNIQMMTIDKIIPYINNPKAHPSEQVKKIASSIKEFGFKVPIVVDKDFVIITGHGRYEAAKLLELKEVPVIIADDLSPAQAKAFRIADNKVAESEWDLEALANELEQLKEIDYNLELTGFDQSELDELIAQLTVDDGEVESFEEEEIQVSKTPFSKRGDIWVLGKHRVLCGDSTQLNDVKSVMEDKKAQLVVTSPPYWNQREYSFWETYSEYENFIHAVITNIIAISGERFIVAWNIGADPNKDLPSFQSVLLDASGLRYIDNIAWIKKGANYGVPRFKHITHSNIYYPAYKWEPIFIYGQGPMPKMTPGDVMKFKEYPWNTNVWEIAQENRTADIGHPAMFPVELASNLIKVYSEPGDIVLDVFGGGGTTLIAAELNNRVARLIEIDPGYIDVIVSRYISMFGDDEVYLIRDGEKIHFEQIKEQFFSGEEIK